MSWNGVVPAEILLPKKKKRKTVLRSKTLQINVLGVLVLLWPKTPEWITAHPRASILGLAVVNILLRFITHEKLELTMPTLPKIFPILLLALACLGASQCTQVPIDQAVSAAEGNDYVVTLSGYGNKSTKGYLFAQANEKASTEGTIGLTFPNVTCKRDSCIRFQFFRKDGSAGYAGALRKGEISSALKLSDIIGHSGEVVSRDEGEYRVIAQVFYVGTDGSEYSMIGSGFVRLNVLSELYRPVACDDPNIAWKVKAGDKCEAQYTTVYRSALCGSGCQ